jgi:hypothetical protein
MILEDLRFRLDPADPRAPAEVQQWRVNMEEMLRGFEVRKQESFKD